jgi:tetratricopeptide (TPR) repeat protein
LRLAIDDKEAHPTTFYNMGVAYLNLQQWTQAINSFSQAIEASNVVNLAGQMSSSYSFRSKAYRKAGDLPKALADSEEALRLASTTVIEHLHHLYFRHYEVLLDCGHRDQAKIYLEKAHRHLMDLAKDLNDAGEKKSFLESHEVNRHILEAWAQIK